MTNPTREALILANGEQPNDQKLKKLAQQKITLVLDGAYKYAHEAGLHVDYLLGDFDSISPELLDIAKSQEVEIIDAPDQNQTDLEKGIAFLDKLNLHRIHICAATGFRMDHTLHNIRILKKYYNPERPITIHTDTEVIFLLQDERIKYKGRKGDGFAILGAAECTVSTKGLLYDMQDHLMSYAENNSICNTMNQDEVDLSVKGSALIIHNQNKRPVFD